MLFELHEVKNSDIAKISAPRTTVDISEQGDK